MVATYGLLQCVYCGAHTDLNYEFGRLDSPARVAIHFTHRAWAIIVAAMAIYFSFIS